MVQNMVPTPWDFCHLKKGTGESLDEACVKNKDSWV